MAEIKIICKSFGFKYGIDNSTDTVFDVRCLPNPFYVSHLKQKTGEQQQVRDYIMNNDISREFLKKTTDYLDFTLPLYKEKGRARFTVSFGCTGGRHRSVTMAILVGEWLKEKGYEVQILHRDIGKGE